MNKKMNKKMKESIVIQSWKFKAKLITMIDRKLEILQGL